jgi:uncharacterized protein (TIGR03000 family)
MTRKPVALLISGVLAAGALSLVAAPAQARPHGGGGYGGYHGGYGYGHGHYGGYGYGRGFYGPYYGGFGYGLGVGLGVGIGYGAAYGGYLPYYGGYAVAPPPLLPNTLAPGGLVPAAPADAPAGQAPAAAPADNKARMLLIVPENAEVWIQGQKTARTGTEREFVSPEMAPGKTYTYKIRVRSTRADGTVADDSRDIRVKANDKWSIDFTKPEPRKE